MLAGVRFLAPGTRAYILAVHNDLFACVIIPCSILFAAPSIRSQFWLLSVIWSICYIQPRVDFL